MLSVISILNTPRLNRWVIQYAPQLDAIFRRKKRKVSGSWRMDETYIKVKGQWVYYYRAVDKFGAVIDFYLSETRDEPAARAFWFCRKLR